MTYQATLDFLFSRLPMFSRIGAAAYRKDIGNIQALCEALGNPHLKFRSVHVGGTNGKGSVSHMLAAALQEAGYKTGLHTSPHLYDFRERIRIDGDMVSEAFVISFTEQIASLIDSLDPSFFEIAVAMAFAWFAEQQVDMAVIEVGLGGRLDSTNIITPVLSVITNIGWDHMNLLGNTLEAIAGEKAGIIKPGIPVVIGQRQEQAASVFERAAKKASAPLLFATDRYVGRTVAYSGRSRTVEIQGPDGSEVIELDLPGIYQENNLVTARAAVDLLRDTGIDIKPGQYRNAWNSVRKKTGLSGRWEMLRRSPSLVLDVAHNADGLKQICLQLAQEDFEKLHLVFGMVRDKEPGYTLPLLPQADHYYFTQAHIPRALPVAELVEAAAQSGLQGAAYEQADDAVEAALAAAGRKDLVLVCGSIFLVAEVDKTRFRD